MYIFFKKLLTRKKLFSNTCIGLMIFIALMLLFISEMDIKEGVAKRQQRQKGGGEDKNNNDSGSDGEDTAADPKHTSNSDEKHGSGKKGYYFGGTPRERIVQGAKRINVLENEWFQK